MHHHSPGLRIHDARPHFSLYFEIPHDILHGTYLPIVVLIPGNRDYQRLRQIPCARKEILLACATLGDSELGETHITNVRLFAEIYGSLQRHRIYISRLYLSLGSYGRDVLHNLRIRQVILYTRWEQRRN